MRKLKVYDLFTGLGGFSLAVQNSGLDHEIVMWSEIDRHASLIYEKNFPHHSKRNVGDIERTVFDIDSRGRTFANEFRVSCLPDVDLIMGGPPCQDLSIAKGKREGLDGEKSGLFWAFSEMSRIKNPKFFLMENVASMRKVDRDIITEFLEVEPIEIDSSMFTPQKRKRLYWFNWNLVEELPSDPPRWPSLVAWSSSNDYCKVTGDHLRKRQRETRDGRANTLTTGQGCSSYSSKNFIDLGDGKRRLLEPWECERLQGLPEGWTDGVSKGQRYRQVGNAITVPVIEYILRSLPISEL